MLEGFVDIEPLINQAMTAKLSSANSSPSEMIRKVIEINPQMGMRLRQEIAKFQPSIILNQVRSQADIDIGFSIQSVCRRYFGIEVDYLGYLDHDPAVWQSVKKRKPLLMEFPNSKLVHHFDRIVHRLLGIS
jgi:flagellar biosynthesis protein FlhG